MEIVCEKQIGEKDTRLACALYGVCTVAFVFQLVSFCHLIFQTRNETIIIWIRIFNLADTSASPAIRTHTHTHRWWHKRGSARCERERSAEKRISILLIKKWRRAINGVAVLIVIVRCIDLSRFTQTHTHTAHADMGHVGRRTPSSRICTYIDRHRPCDFLLRFFFVVVVVIRVLFTIPWFSWATRKTTTCCPYSPYATKNCGCAMCVPVCVSTSPQRLCHNFVVQPAFGVIIFIIFSASPPPSSSSSFSWCCFCFCHTAHIFTRGHIACKLAREYLAVEYGRVCYSATKRTFNLLQFTHFIYPTTMNAPAWNIQTFKTGTETNERTNENKNKTHTRAHTHGDT